MNPSDFQPDRVLVWADCIDLLLQTMSAGGGNRHDSAHRSQASLGIKKGSR